MTIATIIVAVTVLSVWGAQRLAAARHRSARGWMIAAVLLGPLPLIPLAVLPRRFS